MLQFQTDWAESDEKGEVVTDERKQKTATQLPEDPFNGEYDKTPLPNAAKIGYGKSLAGKRDACTRAAHLQLGFVHYPNQRELAYDHAHAMILGVATKPKQQ